MAASRAGRPSIGLQTIIDRLQGNAHRRRKVAAVAPTVEDAEQAAQVLQRSRGRLGRYRDAMLAGGALKPLVRGIGNAAEAAAVAPRGQRLRAAWRGVGSTKGFTTFAKPQLVRDVVEGGLGGAVVNAGREGLELGRAKRTARAFLQGTSAPAPLPAPAPLTPVQQKLAAGLKRGLQDMTRRIQPVPTSKLAPIVDSDYDFEV